MEKVKRHIFGMSLATALALLLGMPFVASDAAAWRLTPSFDPDRLRAIQRQTDLQGQIQRLRQDRMQRDLQRQIDDLGRQHLQRQLKQDAQKFKYQQPAPLPVTPPGGNEEQKTGTAAGNDK